MPFLCAVVAVSEKPAAQIAVEMADAACKMISGDCLQSGDQDFFNLGELGFADFVFLPVGQYGCPALVFKHGIFTHYFCEDMQTPPQGGRF